MPTSLHLCWPYPHVWLVAATDKENFLREARCSEAASFPCYTSAFLLKRGSVIGTSVFNVPQLTKGCCNTAEFKSCYDFSLLRARRSLCAFHVSSPTLLYNLQRRLRLLNALRSMWDRLKTLKQEFPTTVQKVRKNFRSFESRSRYRYECNGCYWRKGTLGQRAPGEHF